MKYFVIGATGLIESHVVDELVQGGDDVVALTRSRSKATDLPEEVTIVEGDITEKGPSEKGLLGLMVCSTSLGGLTLGPALETSKRPNGSTSRARGTSWN